MSLTLIYTIFLFISMWGVGFYIIKFLSISDDKTLVGPHLLYIGLGFLVITNLLFFIGLLELLNVFSVMCIFSFSFVLSILAFQKEKKSLVYILHSFSILKKLNIIFLLLMFIMVLMNLVGALAPPSLADSMNHHLSAPKHYAKIGAFQFIPINPWPSPGLLHILFTKVLMLSDGITCQLIIFCFGFF